MMMMMIMDKPNTYGTTTKKNWNRRWLEAKESECEGYWMSLECKLNWIELNHNNHSHYEIWKIRMKMLNEKKGVQTNS